MLATMMGQRAARKGAPDENGGDPEKASMMESVGDAIEEALGELSRVDTAASVWLPNRSANFNYYKPTHTPTLRIGSAAVTLSGRVWRIILTVLRLPMELLSLASFKAQQVMLGSTMTKLVSVFAVGLPLCLLGGLAYSFASGKPLLTGCLQAYAALYKIPGCTVLGEVNALTANVMNVLWLIGTFTFAIVLGVVTEDITNTVLIAINRSERGEGTYSGPVVVLAERDKELMDRELRRELGRQPSIEWHTRAGAPHSIADLERVNAGLAKTIILMHPELGAGDGEGGGTGKKQVAAMLGVQTLRASTRPRPFLRLSPQHLAVQAPEGKREGELFAAVRHIMQSSAQKLALTQLSGSRDMSMLLAQSAVSPGIASVYSSIVQQTRSGVEFYIRAFPDLEGLSYGAARRAFPDAAVVGYRSREAGGALRMNPRDDDTLGSGDAIIALAETGFFKPRLPKRDTEERRKLGSAPSPPEGLQPAHHGQHAEHKGSSGRPTEASIEGEGSPDGGAVAGGAAKNVGAKRLVVAWWGDEDIGMLARSLAACSSRGSRISVVAQTKPEGFPEKSEMGSAVRFAFLEGDPADLGVLRKAEVGTAAAVVVAGLGERGAKEADALVLTTLLLVQELAGAAKRNASNPAHVVGTVRQPETVEVANFLLDRMGRGSVSAELLQPDELVAAIIAQVAAEPAMGNLLSGFIYAANGQEIYLRRPDAYRLVGCTAAFEQVAELARGQGCSETAIGYITQEGAMRLAPRAANQHKYQANDRIVVIANAGS
ncbi:hypothetical protein WJX81_000586 [Elliptochloris bilobata]|uniref:CASTOR/POLLUX/SYM8 ion channel conserved domain-containing protein n=1 Tax=Elliptochloris bilobata TaxID=381761 RepID=A0AAW1RR73_9CHLO